MKTDLMSINNLSRRARILYKSEEQVKVDSDIVKKGNNETDQLHCQGRGSVPRSELSLIDFVFSHERATSSSKQFPFPFGRAVFLLRNLATTEMNFRGRREPFVSKKVVKINKVKYLYSSLIVHHKKIDFVRLKIVINLLNF